MLSEREVYLFTDGAMPNQGGGVSLGQTLVGQFGVPWRP